jgi:hypothetical protein
MRLSAESFLSRLHCATCAMPFLAAELRMTLLRAGEPELAVRSVAFNETVWPLLTMVTVRASSDRLLPSSTCMDSTFGMTILKFTLAVAVTRAVGAAVCTWDSDAAVSGSNNEAVLINPLNAHVHFTIGFLFGPTSKVSTTGSATLMIISGTVGIT